MKKRSSTEKKAYGSIAAVIILFTMLAITTYALISAIVGVDGNVFNTGTVDIELNGGKPVFDGSDMNIEPGYSAKKDFTVENKGTADVYYRLYLENVSGSLTDSLSFEIYDGDILLFRGSAGEFTRETPCINSKVLEAGKSNAKLLKVVNEGTLAAEIKLNFETSGELEGALWFDFVKVKNGAVTGNFEKRPMSTLSAVAQALELPIIKKGDTLQFILVYGMYEEAGNEYMEDSFTADVTILAKQYTYEEDGFGSSDYDENAKYPAATNTEFVTSLKNGGTVTAAGAFKWSDAVKMTGDTKSVLSLEKDSEITVVDDGIFDLYGSSELTISGEGTLNQTFDSELGYLLRADDNSKVRIDGGTFIAGLTCVQAGGNSSVEIYGGHFEALTDWKGTYWLLNLIDNSAATITVYGGTFVNFDPSKSSTENPQANFVADGYKVTSETHGEDIWYTVVPE